MTSIRIQPRRKRYFSIYGSLLTYVESNLGSAQFKTGDELLLVSRSCSMQSMYQHCECLKSYANLPLPCQRTAYSSHHWSETQPGAARDILVLRWLHRVASRSDSTTLASLLFKDTVILTRSEVKAGFLQECSHSWWILVLQNLHWSWRAPSARCSCSLTSLWKQVRDAHRLTFFIFHATMFYSADPLKLAWSMAVVPL